jgi:hypothetical protein
MRVELYQRKNGFPALTCRSMKSMAAADCRERRAADKHIATIEAAIIRSVVALRPRRIGAHDVLLFLITQRNPTWLIDVSTGCA